MAAAAQKTVSFPTEDGGEVYADVYGGGDRGIVLAHGGRFNKESWEKQARTLATGGFRVLALDFRGYGKSRGPGESTPMSAPLHLDVLAAVRYLRKIGAKSVSVVGGSMGGGAAGDASIASRPSEIDANEAGLAFPGFTRDSALVTIPTASPLFQYEDVHPG